MGFRPVLAELGEPMTPIDARADAVPAVLRLTDEPVSALFARPAVRITLTALAAVFVLFARRYAQMLNPQVWQEEGIIISQAVAHGPLSMFMPLAGYLVIASRCVTMLALLVPLHAYPRVATLLTWAFIVLVVTAIALVPSRLRGGPLLALAVLLVPSDPEVFGLPLYTFWWTIPLLFASYFWRSGPRIMWWRIAAISLAGLSAPTIVIALPLFAIAAIRQRTANAIAAAAAAGACTIVQVIEIVQSQTGVSHFTLAAIVPAIQKLCGGYLIWNLSDASATRDELTLACGLATIVLAAAAMWREPAIRGVLAILGYLWIASALSSLSRVDVNALDQVAAGPRYYFIPFFLEGWILLQIAAGGRTAVLRGIAAAFLVCATFNALPVLSRTHADLAWDAALDACSAVPGDGAFSIPIHEISAAEPHWILTLSGAQCRRMSRHGIVGLLLHH
jgi:hypothetical protein